MHRPVISAARRLGRSWRRAPLCAELGVVWMGKSVPVAARNDKICTYELGEYAMDSLGLRVGGTDERLQSNRVHRAQ